MHKFHFFLLSLFFVLSSILLFSHCCNDGNKTNTIKVEEYDGIPVTKVEMGRRLFFDKRLSFDNSISCASCHKPERAFTDGFKTALGIQNRENLRNTPSILNVKDSPRLMFENEIPSLEMQVLVPIKEHSEMNMRVDSLINRLKKDNYYSHASNSLYNKDFDAFVLTRSLAEYERTLISNNSRFDKYYYGKQNVLSDEEKEGWKIFSEKLNCIACHQLPNFTNYRSENNGLYEDYLADGGRNRITGNPSDIGKFKVPSLRNITLTAPYMHDGSISDLKAVLAHYQSGGKNHPNKSKLITGFQLTEIEESRLLLFFETLVDTSTYKYH